MMANEKIKRFTGEEVNKMTREQQAREISIIEHRREARRRKRIEKKQRQAFAWYLTKGIVACFVCYIVWCFILWVFGVSYM